MVSGRSVKLIAFAAGIGIFLIAAIFVFGKSGYHPSDIVGREVALRLRHAKISVLKLSDAVFFPYTLLPSRLPVYELAIDVKDLRALNEALADWDPDSLIPLRSDKKKQVKADFSVGSYRDRVKIKIRGDSQIHWAHEKKSLAVEFPDENLFGGMRRLNLSVPDSQYYYIERLNDFRAEKLGLLHAESFFVRLKLNGKDFGVYLAEEDTGQEWLEKKGLIGYILDFNEDDAIAEKSIFSEENAQFWESETLTDSYTSEPLAALREILNNADDKNFAKLIPAIVDIDAFFVWDIMTVLSQSREQNDQPPSNNLKLFFDLTTGKFSVIPNNIRIREDEDSEGRFYKEIPLLTQRILSVAEFKKRRDEMLERYISENREEDLAFYDQERARMQREFFNDFQKFPSNLSYISDSKRFRSYVEENFGRAGADIAHVYTASKINAVLNLPQSFKFLREASFSPYEFSAAFPQFVFEYPNTFRLKAGKHIFTRHVVIPAGFEVVIEPEASLFLGEGVSVVSYSPVFAEGLSGAPIAIRALNPARPWGSFLVAGTKNRSVFRHVKVSGGSELKGEINGIFATSMLGFHHANAVLENNVISYSRGEDALNIKYASGVIVRGNTFAQTESDAFDCDSCSGVIEGNYFETIGTGENTKTGFGNTGGDAIDLSFANGLEVRDNVIIGATDKGISIGEGSKLVVSGNKIFKSDIGIAVKDLSRAELAENIIVGNKTGIELYKKKTIFGPGTVELVRTVLWGNGVDTYVHNDGSMIDYGDANTIESQGGIKPNFAAILPASLLRYIP